MPCHRPPSEELLPAAPGPLDTGGGWGQDSPKKARKWATGTGKDGQRHEPPGKGASKPPRGATSRRAAAKEPPSSRRWRGRGERGPFYTAAATVESSMEAPEKVRTEAASGSALSLLRTCPKEMKRLYSRDTCTAPLFTAALLTVTTLQKRPKCAPTDTGIKARCARAADEDSAARSGEVLPPAATRVPEGVTPRE